MSEPKPPVINRRPQGVMRPWHVVILEELIAASGVPEPVIRFRLISLARMAQARESGV